MTKTVLKPVLAQAIYESLKQAGIRCRCIPISSNVMSFDSFIAIEDSFRAGRKGVRVVNFTAYIKPEYIEQLSKQGFNTTDLSVGSVRFNGLAVRDIENYDNYSTTPTLGK